VINCPLEKPAVAITAVRLPTTAGELPVVDDESTRATV
jgi:hypothetical protein